MMIITLIIIIIIIMFITPESTSGSKSGEIKRPVDVQRAADLFIPSVLLEIAHDLLPRLYNSSAQNLTSSVCIEIGYPPLEFASVSIYLPCATREVPTTRIDANERSMIRCILLVTSFTIHFPSRFVNQQMFSNFVSLFSMLNHTSLGHQLRYYPPPQLMQ